MADVSFVHRRALEQFRTFVATVDDTQWTSPTPCEGWDVRALVNHVTAENLWVEPMLDGRTVADVSEVPEGDVLGPDPLGAYTSSATAAATAADRPGATTTTVHVSYGDIPGEDYLAHRLVDLVVHGWDLAVATGQDARLPDELVEPALATVEPVAAGLSDSPAFGEPVPVADGAPAIDRLVGLLGRDPDWQP